MQIIEVSDFAVRSAVIRLRHPETPLRFVCYPMLHMAKATFYADVATRLARADLIVAEGVKHGGSGSVLVTALTMSYRVMRFNRRTELVSQDHLRLRDLGVPIVAPDVSSAELRTAWRRVPLAERAAVWTLLPAVMATRLLGGTGAIWTRAMEQHDLPSSAEEEELLDSPMTEALGGERDDRLLATLQELHETRRQEKIEIAVVYGAAHVPAIVSFLTTRCGYRARSAEWLTITDL